MKKNVLYAGLFNMFLPGSSYLYVDDDRERFGATLVGGLIAFALAILIGSAIQATRGFFLPWGVLPVGLVMIVCAVLFFMGRNLAQWHNNGIDRATLYDGYRKEASGSEKAKALQIRRKHDAKLEQEDAQNIANQK